MRNTSGRKRAFSIQLSISAIFVGLLTLVVLIIFTVTYFRFNRVLTDTSHKIVQQTSILAQNEVEDYLAPLTSETSLAAKLIAEGVIDINELDDIMDYAREVLLTNPHLVSTYWANPSGDFIGVNRRSHNKFFVLQILRDNQQIRKKTHWVNENGKPLSPLQIGTNSTYDPRQRLWYLKAKERKGAIWSDIYRFAGELSGNTNILGMTTAAPVYQPETGAFMGVFGVDIQLEDILTFLSSLKVSDHSGSFIIAENGEFIVPPQFSGSGKIKQGVKFSQDPGWILASFEKYKRGKKEFFTYDFTDEQYIASYQQLDSIVGEPWYVGVVLPEDDFLAEIKQINVIVFITYVTVMLIGFWLVYLFSLKISRPIESLVAYVKKISKLQLDTELVPQSSVKEVYQLQHAANVMKEGLRSFQKYVPASLVRKLVESGEDPKVGGETMPLTVLFTDLENFTEFSESLEPVDLMVKLSEYFEELTRIIIKNYGTIDKFIGDAIMAFWGAPEADPEQILNACNAALALKIIMNNHRHPVLRQIDGNTIFTRIGIHVGDSVVGNVGSSERLNYTAIGDTVNLASRLEGLNKVYGTQIIVSDAVYDRVKEFFAFRFLDIVTVKGRQNATKIYELIGDERKRKDKHHIEYNEKFKVAFNLYQNRKWSEALDEFEQLKEAFPSDTVLPIFINRCRFGMSATIPEDWSGVWIYSEKPD